MINKTQIISLGATKKGKAAVLFLALLLVLTTVFLSFSETTAYASRSSDLTQVNKAKSYLSKVGTLRPVEGTDTNIQTMAQNLVNKVVSGVTVKVASSSNPQIIGSSVVYGSQTASGVVTFSLTKGYAAGKQYMTVTVPATKIISEPAPVVTPPVVTEPVVSAPIVTAPIVTAPVVTEPIITPPVAITPVEMAANAYYVSKSGNDLNEGTAAAPWKTIQKAANTATAGKTVYIMSGTYNERVTVKNSGTSGNFITFENYPGDAVIVDGTGVAVPSGHALFDVSDRNYVKITGIRVQNSAEAGIGAPYSSGISNIIVSSCYTYRTQTAGINLSYGSNIVVDGNTIDTPNLTAQDEAISLGVIDTFEIKNNLVINPQKEGIDAKDGCKNGKIYNNTVKNSPVVGIYIDAYSKPSDNIQVYGNIILNCETGIQVANETGGLLTNVSITDNTITDCPIGFVIGGWSSLYAHPMSGITFSRNTMKITSSGVYLFNKEAKNVTITNNIISGTSSSYSIINDGIPASYMTVFGNTYNIV